MQYATIAQYIETTNDTETVEGSNVDDSEALLADQTHLNRALIAASNKINSRLGLAYSMPIEPAPPDLVRICIRIARFELEVHEVRDVVKEQYDEAIADLDAYRNGKSVLLDVNGNPIAGKNAIGTAYSATLVGQRNKLSIRF